MMGNKGAVAARLRLYNTKMCFVNSHLNADKSSCKMRNAEYHLLSNRLAFEVPERSREVELLQWVSRLCLAAATSAVKWTTR